jgi:hypothetical protein
MRNTDTAAGRVEDEARSLIAICKEITPPTIVNAIGRRG